MKQYLGLDSSTQGLKGVILDGTGILVEESVNFGTDLPEYRSPNGFLSDPDPEVVHADPLLWLAALDLLFSRLQQRGVRLERIAGISGAGQQHGSVYLNSRFEPLLAALDPAKTLAEQLRPALARPTAPIWMDHSTGPQCRALQERFGKRLQQITGSAAAERFTGPQIRKFAEQAPERWAETTRVHLVSSFLCSVLCGKSAPVDYGDGAGMNLLNLKTLQWDAEIAAFTAPGLTPKLPAAVPPDTQVGTLSPYFGKYGFAPGIPVIVWSGDNPSSLVGIGGSAVGSVGISLGTSDTLFAPMPDFRTDPAGCGHVFGNRAGGFLALICFANGSLAREKLRMQYDLSREAWEAAIAAAPPASGKIMLPYFEPECTPPVSHPCTQCNFDPDGRPAEAIRALLETQILAMHHHASWMDLRFHKIRLTGGASRSAGLCRIIADVFQADVELLESPNAAGLGAAMAAANAVEKIPFAELSETFCRPAQVIHPAAEYAGKYEKQLAQFVTFRQERLAALPPRS